MNKTNIFKTLTVILILTVLIVGCAKQPVQSIKVENKQTIKVGVIFALTGGAAMYGNPMLDAVKLAADEINSAGGINGRQIEFIVEDGQCQPKPAANAAQKLANMDKVDVIIGGLCSSETLAAAPIVEQAKVVLLSPSSTSPVVTGAGDYVFRDIASDLAQAKVGAKMMHDAGLNNVAVLVVNDDYGVGIRDAFVDNFKGKVATTVTLEKEGKDFRTELMKVKNSNPDALYVAAFPKEAGLAIKQAKELGINVPLFGTEVLKDDSLVEVAGSAADGLKITVPATGSGSVYEHFKGTYMAKYGREPEAYTAESYDAMYLVANALRKSNGSGEQIKDALYKVQNHNGASGKTTFDENGDPVDKAYDVLELTSGKFVKVSQA